MASRILVVGTVRPEETGRTHPLASLLSDLRQSGQAVELPLSPLNAEETAALAAQVADRPLDAADSGALYRATKGNPLFVVESVRAGCAIPVQRARTIRRRTAPDPRRDHRAPGATLRRRPTNWPGWPAPSARPSRSICSPRPPTGTTTASRAALDELWQRRIIEGQGEEHGVAQYDFTHDRLREVAYAELSPVRRRFLHRRIARALEELHAAGSGVRQRSTGGALRSCRHGRTGHSALSGEPPRRRASGTPMPRRRDCFAARWRFAAISRRPPGATNRNWNCWSRWARCW